MNTKINLKNSKDIFPNKYTKVRREDLVNIITDKSNSLSDSERKKMENVMHSLERRGQNESYAVRKGNIIEFIEVED